MSELDSLELPHQSADPSGRTLTPEETEKLRNDRVLVSDFKQQKLETDAQKNWDLFYKRNTTNFFKDRHWTTREFDELKNCREVRDFARICCNMFEFVGMIVTRYSSSLKGRSLCCWRLAVGLETVFSPF